MSKAKKLYEVTVWVKTVRGIESQQVYTVSRSVNSVRSKVIRTLGEDLIEIESLRVIALDSDGLTEVDGNSSLLI